jgi:hypothetical protein
VQVCNAVREKELAKLKSLSLWRAAMLFLLNASPAIVLVTTFVAMSQVWRVRVRDDVLMPVCGHHRAIRWISWRLALCSRPLRCSKCCGSRFSSCR